MPRPTIDAERALDRQLRALPERALPRVVYPAKNTKRSKTKTTADLVDETLTGTESTIGTLRSRIWPCVILASAGPTRTTIASPKFTSPAMIHEIVVSWLQILNNVGGLAFLWTTDLPTEQTDGSSLVLPKGTKILEAGGRRATGKTYNDQIQETLWHVDLGPSPFQPVIIRPKYIIPTSDNFYLVVTANGGTTAGLHAKMVITVLEGDSREALKKLI